MKKVVGGAASALACAAPVAVLIRERCVKFCVCCGSRRAVRHAHAARGGSICAVHASGAALLFRCSLALRHVPPAGRRPAQRSARSALGVPLPALHVLGKVVVHAGDGDGRLLQIARGGRNVVEGLVQLVLHIVLREGQH